jgi:hypothetical protein
MVYGLLLKGNGAVSPPNLAGQKLQGSPRRLAEPAVGDEKMRKWRKIWQ